MGNLREEDYFPTSEPTSAPSDNHESHHHHILSSGAILGIVIGGGALLAGLGTLIFCPQTCGFTNTSPDEHISWT